MKVALDASLLGARFSGVERSIGELIDHLPSAADASWSFLVYVGNAFDDYVARFHPDGFAQHHGGATVEIVRTGLDNRNRLGRIAWQQMVLPRLVHSARADVFHGPGYIVPALMQTPSVLTLYDLFALTHPQYCTRSNRLHYAWALPAGARKATRIIVPSAYTRRCLAEHLPRCYERTETVPLGVRPVFSQLGDDDAAMRESLLLPDRYLFWVGNVEPKKNVPLLLEAYHRLRQRRDDVPHLVLGGHVPDGPNPAFELLLQYHLHRHVTFTGSLPDHALPAVYRGAALFLFPSRTEGFGLPPLEAMAAGVPVITSTGGALPEVVGDAAITLPPDDADAWATTIGDLLDDEARRAQLVERGREHAAHYTWPRTAEQTLAVYQAAATVGEAEYATGRPLYEGT